MRRAGRLTPLAARKMRQKGNRGGVYNWRGQALSTIDERSGPDDAPCQGGPLWGAGRPVPNGNTPGGAAGGVLACERGAENRAGCETRPAFVKTSRGIWLPTLASQEPVERGSVPDAKAGSQSSLRWEHRIGAAGERGRTGKTGGGRTATRDLWTGIIRRRLLPLHRCR